MSQSDDFKTDILKDVHKECIRQEELWGRQHHPTFPSPYRAARLKAVAKERADEIKAENAERAASDYVSWDFILLEEVFEAFAEEGDPEKMITELTQVAAVAVSWVEDLKRHHA